MRTHYAYGEVQLFILPMSFIKEHISSKCPTIIVKYVDCFSIEESVQDTYTRAFPRKNFKHNCSGGRCGITSLKLAVSYHLN